MPFGSWISKFDQFWRYRMLFITFGLLALSNGFSEAASGDRTKPVIGPGAAAGDESGQCYYCATSPLVIRSAKVRDIFLTAERSDEYGDEDADGESSHAQKAFRLPPKFDGACARPSNFSHLKTQKCRWNYCIKIVVDDKDSDPFVVRGCVDSIMPYAHQSSYAEKCVQQDIGYNTMFCVCKGSFCNGAPKSFGTYRWLIVQCISYALAWCFMHRLW